MQEVVVQLQQVSLFADLKTRDLKRLADLFERVEYEQDDYLSRQGEIGDLFFLFTRGRATVWHVDSSGTEQAIRVLEPGDYFGTTALFLDEARDATVRVARNSTVLSLERSLFHEFLDDFPAIRDDLVLPEALQKRLEAPRFKWMSDDEISIFYATKTRWVLLSSVLLPALLFLILMVIATYVPRWSYLPTILALLAVLVGGGWALVRWADWRNDYYVVTNRRVVHHESRLPTLQVKVTQAPLHQIQNVNMLQSSPMARWLNFGTLDIQTAGRTGIIAFRNLDEPELCQQIIFDLLEKEHSLSKVTERAAIRDAITNQVQPQEENSTETALEAATSSTLIGEALWDLGNDDAPAVEPSQQTDALASIGESVNAFLPHFRQEKGGTVTWHKHYFVLIKALWIPLVILVGAFLIGLVAATSGWDSFNSMLLILFAIFCLSLFWLLWRYEDWRNDIFQMTASHIIDIDRLPLGFRESKRQASLEQVQNINVDIPNVWARIFNFGNVVIETAGAAGDLTFEWVMKPRSVQAEIFNRIEEIRINQRKEETDQRRAEMAEWFAVYHQLKERGEI